MSETMTATAGVSRVVTWQERAEERITELERETAALRERFEGCDATRQRNAEHYRDAAVWARSEVAKNAALAAEIAHLEARRGALLAEVDRLTAALASARADGAREMREAAAAVAESCASERGHTQASMFAAGRPDMAFAVGIKGGEASRIEERIRALPLPIEEVPCG